MEINQQQTIFPDKSIGIAKPRRLGYWLVRNWIVIFAVGMGIYVGLPFLAPLFMQLGWVGAARMIYWIYSFQCHQLPQRSFFLFGSQTMYSLEEIQAAGQNSVNPLVLRQFIGNPQLGWKVAWSDRMVYMYSGTLIFALLWWSVRSRIKPLPWWGLILFLLPMFIDGSTHFLSDLAGLGEGFRYSNIWLAEMTNNALPSSFYIGNALGSFNSWTRLITGLMFGAGVVWFGFPYINDWFMDTAGFMRARAEHEANAA